jgi:hypothetical protein
MPIQLSRSRTQLINIGLALFLLLGLSQTLNAGDPQNDIKIKKATYNAEKNLIKVKGSLSIAGQQHSAKSEKSKKSSKKSRKNKKSKKSKRSITKNSTPTTVELWDTNLDILLGTTNSKRGKFEFKVDGRTGSTIPCSIEVRAISLSAARVVKHAPSECGQFRTNLTGLITDAPVPFATVTVTVNGSSFTTVADQNGAYSLDILSSSVGALLLIEANAVNPETGDPINFVNLAGSFARVLSDPVANVTNVTTASFILAVEANGGTTPTTIQELQSAETAIDATALIELAAVIKLIVDDPRFSLPAGQTNLIDFVADSAAVETFIADVALVDPDALVNTQTAIIQDSDLVAGFVTADIPSRYFAIAAAEPGYMARSGAALEFNTADNTGRFLGFNGNGVAINDPFTWNISQGRLEVSYLTVSAREQLTFAIEDVTDDPGEIAAFYNAGGANGGVTYFSSVVQRNYTRIVDGTLVDIISTEERTEHNTAPILLNDGTTLTIASPFIVINTYNELFRSEQDLVNIPFTTSCQVDEVCALGIWGGVYHYSPGFRVYDDFAYPETSYGEVIDFAADGTASGVVSNRSANWVVNASGNLAISYSDGWVQTLTIIDNLGLEYGVFSSFDNGIDSYASYNIWVRGNNSVQLDENYLLPSQAGKYWNGEVNSWQPGSFDVDGFHLPHVRFGWQFSAGGSLENFSTNNYSDIDNDGNPDLGLIITPTLGWASVNGNVEIDRFSFAHRTWFPIASAMFNGDRIFYVLEKEDRDAELWYGGAPGLKPLFPPRINIQREIFEFTDWDYTEVQGPF